METEHLRNGATLATIPSDQLTPKERHLIYEGNLAYCQTHKVLRILKALPECPVWLMSCKCKDPRCPNIPKIKDVGMCMDLE